MQKITLTNRYDQRIVAVLNEHPAPHGVAIVMHGLGSNKESAGVSTIASALFERGYTVVRFDTTNSFNESDGEYEHATATTGYHDLEDVIAWAHQQPWFGGKLLLAGHSLGAFASLHYAQEHEGAVNGLVLLSPPVSGKLSMEADEKYQTRDMKAWQETGWWSYESTSMPGVIKRLPWSHMEDRLQYDLLPKAPQMTMPILFIVGENDTLTPPEHVRLLAHAVGGPHELHILSGAGHSFRDENHLIKIRDIITRWIATSYR